MNCYVSAALGFGLLTASALTMTVTEEQHDVLRKVLPDKLDEKYTEIITERRNHYLQGLSLGLVLSLVILYKSKINNYFYRVSLFFSISLLTSVLYYFLMPKSDYMLNHLKTPEENKAWLEVYKTMKYRYFFGFLLGALAAIPFANILC